MASLLEMFTTFNSGVKSKLNEYGAEIPTNTGMKSTFVAFVNWVKDNLDEKVDSDDFDTLEGRVDTAETNITSLGTSKADASALTTLAGRVTTAEADIEDLEDDKQDKLVSQTNIKSINNGSILGEGNITLQTPLTADTDYLTPTTASNTYQAKGTYAHLVDGKVPSSELPSYVDDVIEGYYYNSKFYSDSAHTQEIQAETGKIYIDITNPNSPKTYRYSGTAFVTITSGDIVVVDIVQDNNMNAVTSNAVADEFVSQFGATLEAFITG